MDRELELLAAFVSMLKFILEDELSDLCAVNHPAWPRGGCQDEGIDLPMEEEEEEDIMDTSSTKKPGSGRCTMEQKQELLRAFDSYSHPDLDARNDLADRLDMTSDRVKFWFQNHRTHLKSVKITEENALLRMENAKLQSENTELRKRVRARMIDATCPTCHFPLFHTEVEQNICVNHVANPLPQLGETSNPVPHAVSPLLPSSGGLVTPGSYNVGSNGVMMHNYSGMPASTVQPAPSLHAANLPILQNLSGNAEISILVDHAYYAMEELFRLVQINHPLWLPNMDIMGIEALNYQEYAAMSRSIGNRPVGLKVDATRDVAIVKGDCVQLVESLSDAGCWAELFSGIVSSANSTKIISTGHPASCDGLIQLMRAELLVMSPAVPICEVTFLRYSKQIARGLWSVVDVSIDDSILPGESRAAQFSVQASSSIINTATRRMGIRLLPSGCFIQDLDNGYSKVTWVMHAAYDETKVPMLHWPYLRSGKALGACRWLASLQRQSQFLSNLHSSVPGLNNAMEEQLRRRSVLHLVRQMMSRFTAVSGSMTEAWQVGDARRIISRRIGRAGSGEPDGVVLSFTTVMRLPGVKPRRVYDYLRDEQCLFEWRQLFVADLLPQGRTASLHGLPANGDAVPQFHRAANGLHEGHAISLINPRDMGGNISSNLLLQEARTDASGSLIVYAGTDVNTMHGVMNGSIHPAGVFLIPSGCAILPDCHGASPLHPDQASSSTSRSNADGSVVTVTYQMFVSSLTDLSTLIGSIEKGRVAFMNATVVFRAALQAIANVAE
ncbi:hypothetical protein ABZP36_025191 [Zizania latifolia]